MPYPETPHSYYRTPAGQSPEAARVSSRRPIVLLTLITIGIGIEWLLQPVVLWPWLTIAGVCTAGAVLLRAGKSAAARSQWITGLSCVAVACVSVGWTMQRNHRVQATDVAQLASIAPRPFRFRATVTTQPAIRSPQRGPFSRFGYLEPGTTFRAQVSALIDHDGRVMPATGTVLVKIREADYKLEVGRSFEAFGLLRSFPPAMNPGEDDLARIAHQQGLGGVVDIAARSGIEHLDAAHSTVPWWRRLQARARLRASGWIRQDLPETQDTRREALLAALLLGDRGSGLDGLDRSFKRVGLAHLLAISGLHLGILTVTFVLILGWVCPLPWVSRLAVIVLVLLYLFLVPARIPVWRAGVMILLFTIASMRGRRLDALNVWALSAVVVLLWRPDELFAPGAQLSFGIVLAFIVLGRLMRERLWGPGADVERMSAPEYFVDLGKTFIALTLLAYLISAPLVAHSFDVYNPIAPLAALLAAPLAALALGIGYVKIVTASIYPSLGVVLGPALALSADGLIGLVDRLDQLPLSSVPVIEPGVVWTVLTTALIAWWVARPMRAPEGRMLGRVRLGLIVLLVAWPLRASWPLVGTGRPDAVQIAMLAVGDGTCLLARSGAESILFDAGSGSDYEIGDSTIVPTLRKLGVFHVSTLFLSHGDLDHFSGALDVVDEFGVGRVVINPQFAEQAEDDPFSPPAFLLEQLEQRGVQIDTCRAGHRESVGRMQLTFLHPGADASYERSNESSSVIRIEALGRRILLTGDLQGQGLEDLVNRGEARDLEADILELPHHGSWSDEAVAFVERVDPQIVLQSTGAARLVLDRWAAPPAGQERLVTARDGMIEVIIHGNGALDVRSTLHGAVGGQRSGSR